MKLRKECAADPEYSVCAVTGDAWTWDDPIQWHHAMKWKGSQLQKKFAIVALKRSIHEQADNTVVKAWIDRIVLNRMTDEELDMYSKAENLRAKRDRLNKEYGPWEVKQSKPGINYSWVRK